MIHLTPEKFKDWTVNSITGNVVKFSAGSVTFSIVVGLVVNFEAISNKAHAEDRAGAAANGNGASLDDDEDIGDDHKDTLDIYVPSDSYYDCMEKKGKVLKYKFTATTFISNFKKKSPNLIYSFVFKEEIVPVDPVFKLEDLQILAIKKKATGAPTSAYMVSCISRLFKGFSKLHYAKELMKNKSAAFAGIINHPVDFAKVGNPQLQSLLYLLFRDAFRADCYYKMCTFIPAFRLDVMDSDELHQFWVFLQTQRGFDSVFFCCYEQPMKIPTNIIQPELRALTTDMSVTANFLWNCMWDTCKYANNFRWKIPENMYDMGDTLVPVIRYMIQRKLIVVLEGFPLDEASLKEIYDMPRDAPPVPERKKRRKKDGDEEDEGEPADDADDGESSKKKKKEKRRQKEREMEENDEYSMDEDDEDDKKRKQKNKKKKKKVDDDDDDSPPAPAFNFEPSKFVCMPYEYALDMWHVLVMIKKLDISGLVIVRGYVTDALAHINEYFTALEKPIPSISQIVAVSSTLPAVLGNRKHCRVFFANDENMKLFSVILSNRGNPTKVVIMDAMHQMSFPVFKQCLEELVALPEPPFVYLCGCESRKYIDSKWKYCGFFDDLLGSTISVPIIDNQPNITQSVLQSLELSMDKKKVRGDGSVMTLVGVKDEIHLERELAKLHDSALVMYVEARNITGVVFDPFTRDTYQLTIGTYVVDGNGAQNRLDKIYKTMPDQKNVSSVAGVNVPQDPEAVFTYVLKDSPLSISRNLFLQPLRPLSRTVVSRQNFVPTDLPVVLIIKKWASEKDLSVVNYLARKTLYLMAYPEFYNKPVVHRYSNANNIVSFFLNAMDSEMEPTDAIETMKMQLGVSEKQAPVTTGDIPEPNGKDAESEDATDKKKKAEFRATFGASVAPPDAEDNSDFVLPYVYVDEKTEKVVVHKEKSKKKKKKRIVESKEEKTEDEKEEEQEDPPPAPVEEKIEQVKKKKKMIIDDDDD